MHIRTSAAQLSWGSSRSIIWTSQLSVMLVRRSLDPSPTAEQITVSAGLTGQQLQTTSQELFPWPLALVGRSSVPWLVVLQACSVHCRTC